LGHTHVTRGCNYPFLTRKERDIETGLDFFEARYYASTQGRFTSPDEFTGGPLELYHFAEDASANPTFYSDLRKPQSLNRYQYAYNNPLRWIDPDGHEKNDPQKKKKPDDVDVVVIKTIDPKIISFDVKLIDRVPRVEALTKHDSRYIFNRSNRIIPQDRLVKESDIQGAVRCLVDDLKASGMFADVRAKLVRTSEVDVRKLEIETVYHRQMANFTISEIALVKLPQVDEAKFQMALKKRGITPCVFR
jgi:RHS repeat-associated protein